MAMSIAVCLPTFNRAPFLTQAIESVQAQTHEHWHLFVIDDGSTDDTETVVERAAARTTSKVTYVKVPENRGGVAANEIGMSLAVGRHFDAWTRLGSDDWYLPRKLELDAMALEDADACFGPYRNEPETYDGELNVPCDARAMLLRGEFAASWANVAYRTSVLAKVVERHGNFVDPRIRNMEDNLFGIRAARFTEFVWRGELLDGRIAIGLRGEPSTMGSAGGLVMWKPDARYRIGADPVCCSNSAEGRRWGALDAQMTLVVRGEDHLRGFPVTEIPPPALRIIP